MIVDAHQHFWIYDPTDSAFFWMTDQMGTIRRTFLPSDAVAVLKENSVDCSIAIQAGQTEDESNFLLKLANENSFIQGVVGWVDLRAANISERLEHFRQFPLMKGFRHLVQEEQDPKFLLRDDFCRGIAELSKFDFTYDILVFSHQLPAAVEFVKRFPNQRFIIDHLGKPCIKSGELEPWAAHMRILGQHSNVYCKFSGVVSQVNLREWSQDDFKPYLDVVFQAFGADRILYGSDWPLCLLAGDYAKIKNVATDYIAQLSWNEQDGVMGENARKFYKLM